jgi:CRISPR-associated protein Cmr2
MADWEALACIYVGSPPDRALEPHDAAQRAQAYLKAVGLESRNSRLEPLRAHVLRLLGSLLPSDWDEPPVPQNRVVQLVHPLDGTRCVWTLPGPDPVRVGQAIEELVGKQPDARSHFLAIWRFLPERLTALDPVFNVLPYDWRLPCYSVWNVLDVAAAMPVGEANGSWSLLGFKIGPVQPFFAAARTSNDLCAGALILSWVTLQGMGPLIESCGPQAILFPDLRGNPLVDLYLRHQGLLPFPPPTFDVRFPVATLPNWFLAVVPAEEAATLARQCREAAQRGWEQLAAGVHERWDRLVRELLPELAEGWDRTWWRQIRNSFFITSTYVKDTELSESLWVEILQGKQPSRNYSPTDAEDFGPSQQEVPNGKHSIRLLEFWQAATNVVSCLLTASRQVFPIHKFVPDSESSPKCSLLGTWEQVGPTDHREASRFWAKVAAIPGAAGIRFKPADRFCAIGLVKRLAPLVFRELLLSETGPHLPDLATIAAAKWLAQAQSQGLLPSVEEMRANYREWCGSWLYWPRPDFDPHEPPCPPRLYEQLTRAKEVLGRPPAYVGLLCLDTDRLGNWLRGDLGLTWSDLAVGESGNLSEPTSAPSPTVPGRLPVSPFHHRAVAEILGNYAREIVPGVVADCGGVLAYAGAGDAWILLPAGEAIPCAAGLRRAFQLSRHSNSGVSASLSSSGWGMGSRASFSTGLVVMHFEDDLKAHVARGREALSLAKRAGKDLLGIIVATHGLEGNDWLCPWGYASRLIRWRHAFEQGASDRWVQRLLAEERIWRGLSSDAITAMVRRELDACDAKTRRLLGGADAVVSEFRAYAELLQERVREASPADAFRAFLLGVGLMSVIHKPRGANRHEP